MCLEDAVISLFKAHPRAICHIWPCIKVWWGFSNCTSSLFHREPLGLHPINYSSWNKFKPERVHSSLCAFTTQRRAHKATLPKSIKQSLCSYKHYYRRHRGLSCMLGDNGTTDIHVRITAWIDPIWTLINKHISIYCTYYTCILYLLPDSEW